jgi:hypothetical protein
MMSDEVYRVKLKISAECCVEASKAFRIDTAEGEREGSSVSFYRKVIHFQSLCTTNNA